MSGRYSEQRRFVTIESTRLPIVGEENRYRQRAALWRCICLYGLLVALGAFLAIACA
jgi:hypothetical protein